MGSDLWPCETEGGKGCVLCQRVRILVTPTRQWNVVRLVWAWSSNYPGDC